MARIALWTFGEPRGATVAQDSEAGDGTAQDGVFQNGATTNGSGSAVLDGIDDYVEIPHDPGFDLATGSIAITFTQHTASSGSNPWGSDAAQTLFSRDSMDLDGGGHLTIYVRADGSIGVRHQDTDSSHVLSGGTVTLGQPTSIIYSWGPAGSNLIVDGVVVDTGTEALTLAGNSEPMTIGASQAQSGDGTADNLQGFFDGEIHEVAIYDKPAQGNSVPCFTRGTGILTPFGEVPVEELRVGDPVWTMDHGPQPIRWIGSRRVELEGSADDPARLRPVRITAGALGCGFPKRDLLVSRQHRMLISSRIAARMFDGCEVLCPAIKLTELPGIRVDEEIRSVEYFHLAFDRHEVIFSEHSPAESLYAGAEALNPVAGEARREIAGLFADPVSERPAPEPARPIPPGRLQRQLVARHAKNRRPLLELFADLRWMDAVRRKDPDDGPRAHVGIEAWHAGKPA